MRVAWIVLCLTLALPAGVAAQAAPLGEAPTPAADSVTSAGEAFLTGAAAGLVAGAVIGRVAAEDDLEGYNKFFGMLGGAVLGALIGGLAALFIHENR